MRSLAIKFCTAKLVIYKSNNGIYAIFNVIFNTYGIQSEPIAFFKQRMVELYDRNTLDSYSVRTCNTMSIFCEMREIINGWIIGNVRRGETVGLCIDEVWVLDKEV